MIEITPVDVIIKMIGPGYTKSLITMVIPQLFPVHKYVPFKKMDDLEGVIYVTCQDHGWDPLNTLAIHSDDNLTDSQGNKFGSCLIIPHVTQARFVENMQRAISMKAFI